MSVCPLEFRTEPFVKNGVDPEVWMKHQENFIHAMEHSVCMQVHNFLPIMLSEYYIQLKYSVWYFRYEKYNDIGIDKRLFQSLRRFAERRFAPWAAMTRDIEENKDRIQITK